LGPATSTASSLLALEAGLTDWSQQLDFSGTFPLGAIRSTADQLSAHLVGR
jgi:hypothetical protein